MRTLSFLFFSAICFVCLPAHATLYKCQDTSGKITYTNLPCDRSGLKETKVIPPPPPPAEPVAAKPAPAAESRMQEKPVAKKEKKDGASLQLIKSQEPSEKKCTRLNDQLGATMDEMDDARRKGYTAKQEAAWNAKLKKLQAEKNKHGCF